MLTFASLTGCNIKNVDLTLPSTLPELKKKASVQNAVPDVSPEQQKLSSKLLPNLHTKLMQPLTEKAADQLKLPAEEIAINVDALPLNEFIHMALGEIMGLSFEVDAQIASRREPVTLHITQPVKPRRLLDMIEQTLRAYDIFIAWSPQGLRVMPITKAGSTIPLVVSERSKVLLNMGRAMTIIPLRYAEPSEALAFARHFMHLGSTGEAIINPRLNALVVIDMPDRLAAFQRAIELIDTPNFQNKKLLMIRPVYWQASELSKALEELLAAQDIPLAKAETKHGIRIITVEPINALVIASPEPAWVNLINEWVSELDTAEAAGEESNSYVYFVKNASAKGLGEVLTSILGGADTSASSTSLLNKTTQKNPDESAPVSAIAGNRSKLTQIGKNNNATEGAETAVGEGLRVVVDEERNALIFIGTARAYRSAYNLLQQLDKEPRQVLIEATVADITLDDTTKLGVEWQVEHHDSTGNGVLGTLGKAGLGALTGGLGYTFNASDVAAQISALALQKKAKILSSPRLLTKDNEQANIQVGNQIAVVSSNLSNTQSATDNGTNIIQNITYVDTGVILGFTPTILEDGKVELKISQEVSEPGDSTANTPPIFKRKVETVLTASSGETVMIGGLISHNEAVTDTKVPWLGDIPVVGWLFSTLGRQDKTTNMVILITPHIVSNSSEAAYLTKSFQEQMNWNVKEEINTGTAK